MIDSGSFVTIANCAKTFPGHTVRPSAGSRSGVTYSNASGGDIPNRGEIVITHQLDDFTELDIPFQDGDVQLPIISVKDFVRKNSVVKFKRNGGIIKLPSGSVMRFVEKFGVYFICLSVTSGTLGNSSDIVDEIVDRDNHGSISVVDKVAHEECADLPHSVPSVRFDLPPPCADDSCRDKCCRRGLIKRPGRKSSFTRPEP
jgi:hypothetical protein